MSRNWSRPVVVSFVMALLIVASAEARGKSKAPKEPGSYTDWKGEIDRLEIVTPFESGQFSAVVIEPVDGSAAPLPDQGDNTYQPVQKVLAGATGTMTAALARELQSLKVTEGEGGEAGAIVLRMKVEKVDPGSRAARYWAGFGAGAAAVKIRGEALDASSGEVLFRFEQERRSGVGVAGGGYEDLLNRNLRAIAEDIAMILREF